MVIGIVLATASDLADALALARAARASRHEVAMFVMDAGCAAIASVPDEITALLDDDVEITACSNSAVGIALPDGVERGSQDDHAAVAATDRLVAFT